MFHPWLRFGGEAATLHTAARRHGTHVLGCVINPGFCFESLPLLLLRTVHGVRSIEVRRTSDVGGIGPSDFAHLGFGLDATTFAARVADGGAHLSALAGAQPKMSVQRDGMRLTLPGRGETGGWIVKFASGAYPSLAENEYLMMSWAASAGLDVPPVDLLPTASVPNIFGDLQPGSLAFLVERFDRGPDGRVHIEDLAQVTGTIPELRFRGATYDGIGVLVRALTGDAGFEEYLRRLVAMVVMGNGDSHLKNWSLRYPDGRTPTLSPAYDLVCTTVYGTLSRALVFPLGGRSRLDAVDADAIVTASDAAGYSPGRTREIVGQTAERLRTAWREVRREPLFPELVAHVDDRVARHPLPCR